MNEELEQLKAVLDHVVELANKEPQINSALHEYVRSFVFIGEEPTLVDEPLNALELYI